MKVLKKPSLSTANLLKIGLLANAFEWYEFSVFLYLSTIIGKLFFHTETPVGELLRVFTLFAFSYLMRPIGSVFFGLLGDKRGRGYSLRLSLILVTVSTVFIGLLPTYSQFGISATLLLVSLRMIQGFAMGGELPSTACYVYEASPAHSRSLFCSTVGTATKVGLLLGSLNNYLLVKLLDQQTLLDWGWRIPFWLGAPLTVLIAYIRRSIQETVEFAEVSNYNKTSVIDWDNFKWPLLRGIAICTFLNVGFPILTIWMPSYLHVFLGIPQNTANLLNTISLCVMVPLCLGFGYLSQYVGYCLLYIGSLIGTVLFNIPIFWGLHAYTSFNQLLGLHMLLALLASVGQGIFVEMIGDLFPLQNRNLGLSLSFILPASFVGGTVSLICTKVIYATNWVMFPAYYTIISAFIALPAVIHLKQPNFSKRKM